MLDSPLWWRVYTRLDDGSRGRQAVEDRGSRPDHGPFDQEIRYYESRGLLEKPPRTESGYRLYGPEEVARLRFVQRAKLLGLTLEEIRELVELAVRCNEGEIVPRLEEVLEAKLKETERKMVELSAFRQNLLYYRERTSALSGGLLPTDRYCEDVSFCGCLEAVTGEGGEKL